MVAAVEVRVRAKAPAVISDEPVISVSVAEVPGAVIVTLLMVVAVAAPRIGAIKVGPLLNTRDELPEPVEPEVVKPVMLLKAVWLAVPVPMPPLATGSTPVTPVVSGKPVALVSTNAVGVPSAGVTNVGLVARTTLPEPIVAVQAGDAEMVPLPVWVNTAIVADVLPASRAGAGVAFSKMMSPSVVIGLVIPPPLRALIWVWIALVTPDR